MKILSLLHFARRFQSARWAPIALRLMAGYGFMEHGYAKLARGPESFIHILQAMGMPVPHVLGWATILIELIGGAAILAGAFVALASVPMVIVLLVAIFTVHLPNGFSSIKLQSVTAEGAHFGQPGYETDLLYLACLAGLVLGGSGAFSVDTAIAARLSKQTKNT
ncbi:MAG TPA: DoxX family protein [Steroidobacteraceae bacterium]|jgi:putative oxidoreductase